MPYFKWRGITIEGQPCYGKKVARSPETLTHLLAQKNIAVLECKPATNLTLFRRVTLSQKINFFEQLATLIDAGILVPQALLIINTMLEEPSLQEIVCALCNDIEHGQTLSAALAHHPKLFTPLTIQLIKAGEEAGDLPTALRGICTHMHLEQQCKNKLQAALAVPIITVLFMLVAASVIIVVILPRFATFFMQLKKDLPPLTKRILALSSFAQSRSFIYILGIVAATLLAGYALLSIKQIQSLKNRLILSVPIIGPCMKYRFLTHFFQSFALLLTGGNKVIPALNTICSTITNDYLALTITSLTQDINAGQSVSNAMSNVEWLFDSDIVAMVHVGEESGRLATMLTPIAQRCQARLYQKLNRITVLIQPLLMILLGLCITALIIAIYAPLCSLADITP